MKKFWLFFFSFVVAFGITLYTKKEKARFEFADHDQNWKTYVKKTSRDVASYKTTEDEITKANIVDNGKNNSRSPASIAPDMKQKVRGKRILIGQVLPEYTNPDYHLLMANTISSDWQEKMGNDLMRFQPEGTKVLVKDELPVIKIKDGRGKFFEQVVVTYLLSNGDRNSFRALVDSETGLVDSTWDRTINEGPRKQKEFDIPSAPSNITTR
jgi:hypothetical protein